ncbi:MAG: hypothetical protein ACFFC3_03470 [Candidatus Odinarchaeota archaeon]
MLNVLIIGNNKYIIENTPGKIQKRPTGVIELSGIRLHPILSKIDGIKNEM